jgi:hypothetical protein
VSNTNDKGRPAPWRRPASFRARLVGWVDRVVPWFAATATFLVAVWLAFPLFWTARNLVRAGGWDSDLAGVVAMYAGAFLGVVFLGLTALRTVSPEDGWPRDGQVRAFASIGLLLTAITVPLLVLRRGELIPAIALVIYYVRTRRALVAILPPWCGGTYKPQQRRRPQGEDVIKRPPRSWDATSGPGPATAARPARTQRKRGKKKRRTGR